MKKIKEYSKIILYIIFLLAITLPFIIYGAYDFINIQIKIHSNEYIKTEAKISNIEYYTTSDGKQSSNVFIDYLANGKEYKNIEFNISISDMKIGDKHKIYFNKNNPKEIITNGNIYLGIPFFISGLFILIFALIIPIKKEFKNKRKQKDLLQNGKQIYVKVESILYNYKTGEAIAKCKYIDENNNIYIMTSEPTFHDLTTYFQNMNENLTLTAYTNPQNIRDYYLPIKTLFGETL